MVWWLAVPAGVQAQFSYITENGGITITGYTGPGGAVVIPSTTNDLPVRRIANRVFAYNYTITSVAIPDTVVSIGNLAFDSCTKMTSVSLGTNVASIGDFAFNQCMALPNITLPATVTNIGPYTFQSCYTITNITIPRSLLTVGEGAFANCFALPAIIVEPGNPNYIAVDGVLFNTGQTLLCSYPDGKIGTAYSIPPTVTQIGGAAFWSSALSTIIIPSSVTSFAQGAFGGCANLTEITIPSSVTTIENNAFFNSGLHRINIPNSVGSLGSGVFQYCNNLTNANLGDGVSSIGDSAFSSCEKLTAITVSSQNSWYSSLDGVLFNKPQSILLQFPAGRSGSYSIPTTVSTIARQSFERCNQLIAVTVPPSVTRIKDYAFWQSSSLAGLYFWGTPPALESYTLYANTNTVYYIEGTPGWGATFGDRPTAVWLTQPMIFQQPANQAVPAWSAAALSVTAAGSPILSYQWQCGGSNLTDKARITGAQSSMLQISPAAQSDAGEYRVIVANAYGSVTSSVATLNIGKAVAALSLGNLTQIYDGSAKPVSVSTLPPNLPVTLTYDGSPFAPTNAGNYVIVATVTDPDFSAAATNVLVIQKASAIVNLAKLSQTWDGTPKSVTATTVPPNLSVVITYNGGQNPPANAGVYSINALVTDANHQGQTTGVLNLSIASASNPYLGMRDSAFEPLAFTMRCFPNYCVSDGRDGLLWSFVNNVPNTFAGANNVRVGGLVRTTVDGVVDPTFVVGPTLHETMGVVVQPDGRILVGARLADDVTPDGMPNYRVFRLQTNGVLDTTYHSPAFSMAPRFMVLQPDGKLVACLNNLSDASPSDGRIVDLARLNPDGSLDQDFQKPVLLGGLSGVFAPPVLDTNGFIYLAGGFTSVNNQPRQGVARLNPDGSLDAGFVPSGYNVSSAVRGILIQPGGLVVIAGRLKLTGATSTYYPLLRLNPNGAFDPTFNRVTVNSIGFYRARLLEATPDGKLLTVSTSMARFNSDGSLDPTFIRLPFEDVTGTNPYTECYWFDQLPDGRLVLPSDPSFGLGPVKIGGQPFDGSVRLLANGDLDPGYAPPTFQQTDFPVALALQPDHGLLVGGRFNRLGTNPVNCLVRLNPDSSPDTNFTFTFANLDSIDNVAVLPSAKVFVAGNTRDPFTFENQSFLARIHPDGKLDNTFDPGPAASILAQGPQHDFLMQGELPIVTGSSAQSLLDQTNVSIARFLPDGSRDPAFNVPVRVSGLGFLYDGSPITDWSTLSLYDIGMLVVGDFQPLTVDPSGGVLFGACTNLSGTTWTYQLLRLQTNGTPDVLFTGANFSPVRSVVSYPIVQDRYGSMGQVQVTSPIRCLTTALVQSNGCTLFGGSFTNVNGAFRPGVARLLPDSTLDPNFPAQGGPAGTASSAPVVISGLSLDSAGCIWVTGNFLQWDGYNAPGYVRLNSDGTVDTNCVPQISHSGVDDYYTFRFSGVLPADSIEAYAFGPHRLPGETWPRALSHLTRFPPPPVQPAGGVSPAGFDLILDTTYGQAYWLQTSSDLMTWENWINFTGTGQPITVNDSAATNATKKFYRLKYQQ